ncbi:hypothetical protein [Persephonella sp.]
MARLLFVFVVFWAYSIVGFGASFEEVYRKELKKAGLTDKVDICTSAIEKMDENLWNKNNCEDVMKKAEEIRKNVLERFLSILEKEMKSRMEKAKKLDVPVEVYGYRLNERMFYIVGISKIDTGRYDVFKVKTVPKAGITRYCTVPEGYFFFVPAGSQSIQMTVFLADRNYIQQLENFVRSFKTDKVPSGDLYRVDIEIDSVSIKPVQVNVENKKGRYIYRLNMPVVVTSAYAIYDYVDVKKDFSPVKEGYTCRSSHISLDSPPDGIYLEITVEEGNHIMDRSIRVY